MVTRSYVPLVTHSGINNEQPTEVVATNDWSFRDDEKSATENMYRTDNVGLVFGRAAKTGEVEYAIMMFDTTSSGILPAEDPIAPGSVIQDAILRITSASTTSDGTAVFQMFVPSPDGRWSNLNPVSSGFVNHREFSLDMTVVNASGTVLVETLTAGNSGNTFEARLRTVEGVGPDSLGQGFYPDETLSGTLDHIDLEMKRGVTDVAGDVWLEIYDSVGSTIVNDTAAYVPNNDNDFPDIEGGMLAKSDLVTMSGLPTDLDGATQTFDFSGADRIEIEDQHKYVALLKGDYDFHPANNARWMFKSTSGGLFGIKVITGPYSTPVAGVGGMASCAGSDTGFVGGFNDMQYQTEYQAPYPTNDAGTQIHLPISGTNLLVGVPDLAADETFDFDVTTLVQETVHVPWYDGTMPICICVAGTTVFTGIGDQRFIHYRENPDDSLQAELIITLRENRRVQVI